jgi:hypothetical protein
MGNLADRLKTVEQLKPLILVDELQSTGELMVRIAAEAIKKVEAEPDAALAVILLIDTIAGILSNQPLSSSGSQHKKQTQSLDNFVPKVSFDRFQQRLEQNATRIGLKKNEHIIMVKKI